MSTSTDSLEGVLGAGRAEFDRIEFIYNKANALSCSGDNMSFIVVDDNKACPDSTSNLLEDPSPCG